jgi:hypothetical protein
MNVRHLDDDDGSRDRAMSTLTRSTAAILRRPSTWRAAVGALVRFAPRGWWRHPPFLPAPDERYWQFRMETAYGDEGASPDGHDVSTAVTWSRRARARRR